ncbi:MAG TPA: hypothetical protein VGP43_00775 [Chitinophagaceae bacterium]|nr:hypothetical protein [Chitinophagaceae bacterium]
MLLKLLRSVYFLVILFSSCTQQKFKIFEPSKKDTTAAHAIFPVTEYIRGQLKELETLPVTPVKITTQNGVEDSIWLKKENIRTFAEPFLHPEIDSSNFNDLFSEKSFFDQTIDAYTFSYDPIDKLPDTLQLRRWDVYIDPKKNTIKRIFIIKEIIKSGTRQIIQLTWKSNQWCKITTITEPEGKPIDIKVEEMKWDFSE